jgi:hypothetical protein
VLLIKIASTSIRENVTLRVAFMKILLSYRVVSVKYYRLVLCEKYRLAMSNYHAFGRTSNSAGVNIWTISSGRTARRNEAAAPELSLRGSSGHRLGIE